MAKKNGLNPYPTIAAELGPSDFLYIGLVALIYGCQKYPAFDVVKHAKIKRNLSIFNELVTLFKDKTPIPGNDECPKVKLPLDNYDFPSHILDDNRLHKSLENSRIKLGGFLQLI